MKVYNSTFETILRLLCLLDLSDNGLSTERILILDFISTFGKTFHVAEENLHGDNLTSIAELAARRVRVKKALKKMVQLGYIIPEQNNIFLYRLSDYGELFAKKLESTYAGKYRETAKKAYHVFAEYTDVQLISLICVNNGGMP